GVRSPLVGRAAEAAQVRGAIEGVRAGRGAFVAVIGEAGLGKSRLIAEARDRATAEWGRAVAWLEGRALSYGQALSYAPGQQLLVAALVADQPLLIVGLLRPDRDAASWRLIERVGPALGGRFARIALEPLSAEQARELLANLLNVEGLTEDVRQLILTRA